MMPSPQEHYDNAVKSLARAMWEESIAESLAGLLATQLRQINTDEATNEH